MDWEALREIIRRASDARAAEVFTTFPGRVETYDPATQTADVAPVVRRHLPTEEGDIMYEDLPILPNVPVCFPRGGGCYVQFPLVKGDHVLIHVSMLGTAEWRKDGETSDPGDLRLHHPANCFAVPCVAPNSGALPLSLPGTLTMEATSIKAGEAAQDAAGNGEATKAWIDALKTAVTTLGGTVGPVPPPYATTATILAAKLKVER
jgi:hypothetical protein